VSYKGNASVSEWLHRGDGGVSGEGNGARTTQRVAAEALVSVPEGVCGPVHDGFGQSFATWPVAVFQKESFGLALASASISQSEGKRWLAVGRSGMETEEWPATIGAARSWKLRQSLRDSGAAVVVDEGTNRVDRNRTVGGEKTVMPHLHKSIGQDVLEETSDELQDVEGGDAVEVGSVLPILEGDGTVFDLDDAAIGNGDLEDIGREVLEGSVAFPDGLGVDIPVEGPDLRVDSIEESSSFHGVTELGSVDGGEGLDGDIKVLGGRKPAGAVVAQAAARDDVVDVGVVLELTAPGLQDTEEAREIGADETRVLGQPFQGLGGGFEQGMVGGFWVGADEDPELFGHGKGDQEIVCGKASGHLLYEPLLGFVVLAVGTVAIAAGPIDEMVLPATPAVIEGDAQFPTLAVDDGLDDFSVLVGDALGVTLEIFGSELGEDIFDGRHDPTLLIASSMMW